MEIQKIIEEAISREIKKAIMENTDEIYMIKDKEGQAIEMCDTQEEADAKLDSYKKEGKEFIIEKGPKPSIDDLDAMGEKIENMENTNDMNENNEHKGYFTTKQVLKLAKKAGEDVMDAEDELIEVCVAYGDKIPASRVFGILDNYDMPELKSKIKVIKPEAKKSEEEVDEKLIGNQSKIDANHNGEVDADDFKKLRGDKNEEMLEGKWEVDPGYNHFAVHKDNGKVFTGWKYDDLDKESIKQYAKDDIKDNDWHPKHFKVVTTGHLKRNGINPHDSDTWATNQEVSDYMDGLDGVNSNEKDMKEKKCADCESSMEESNVCEKCGKEICECGGGMYEGKKTIRVTEAELITLIKNISEAVPGLDTYKKAHKGSGEINKAAISDIDKELKSYLNFDGNDNPEFPHQEGGEKVARKNTDEEDELVATNRGGGMEDLDYDVEPSKQFTDRVKMSLIGDTKMGNSHDAANVIPSKLGEKIIKKVERRKKEIAAAPMYAKDPAPIKNVNEAETKDYKVVLDEIKRMIQMSGYDKKTQ